MPVRAEPRRRLKSIAILTAVLLCGCGDFTYAFRARIESEDRELRRMARRILPAVERLSGLRARGPIIVARQNQNGLLALMRQELQESLAEMEAALETNIILGLAPADMDVYSLVNSGAGALDGYYDFRTKRLYVLTNVDPIDVEIVLAHELVHAVQDQHMDLGAILDDDEDDDRALAFRAAVEGHATLVMVAWSTEQLLGHRIDPATMPNVADQIMRMPVLPTFRSRDGPRALERIFLFPCTEGSAFVQTLWKYHPDRRAAALDSLRPFSTEQVLNPERSLLGRRDEPVPVRLDEPPAGWTTRFETTMGEYGARLVLEESLGSNAATAAGGWRGDHLRLLDDGADARVLQWLTTWDNDVSADAFDREIRRFVESRAPGWTGRVFRSGLDGVPVVRIELWNAGPWSSDIPGAVG